ncbi:MAG TPA: PIG-L family deacetylase [Pyrinomonadaceae bacterium]|nr:PIG-L family deacetylase [Pyrinomonadaceae bacterium]
MTDSRAKRRCIGSGLIAVLVIATICQPAIFTVRYQEPALAETASKPTVNEANLRQAVLDLLSPWTIMCVAAHPDDEDGTTLTVLRRRYGVHTVTLFSTYGEGGQNAIGPELYEELGVIREAETRRASAIQGSQPHFLGLRDFGFSKSADETFRFWNREEALRRMVLKIRELRPHAIITNHDMTSGHGHHQATGRLVLEAFDAAADPQKFPEQLSAVGVWQVKRLFVRARRGSSGSPTAPEEAVVIDPNETDPVRGTTFGEQALLALQQHASQGPWPKSVRDWLRMQNNQTGKLNLIRYRFVKQAREQETATGVYVPFVYGLAPPLKITPPSELNELPLEPDETLSALIRWSRDLPKSNSTDIDKSASLRKKLDRALAAASGVSLSISSGALLVPGRKTSVTVTLTNTGASVFRVHSLSLSAWEPYQRVEAAEHLLADTETTANVEVPTPVDVLLSVPKAKHLYDGLLSGKTVRAQADLELDPGIRFQLNARLNLDVAPAVEIVNVSPQPIVKTPATNNRPIALKINLKNHTEETFVGALKLTSPAFRIFEFGKQVSLAAGESQTVALEANATIANRTPRQGKGSGSTVVSVEKLDSNVQIVNEEIPVVRSNALVRSNLRVGYIPSFDDTLETALTALGVEAKSLTMDEVRESNLSIYDTIIVDNRGYEAHPELVSNNSRLLQFISDGGTLLVFYHKDSEWNPSERRSRPQLAPLPILLGGERVTEEDASIRLRMPSHRMLNHPNRITQRDFGNWVQERGLYYPREWDAAYQMLFSTNDTGEKPLSGGLLVANYGKGNYIYTSMVWYRQLREGHPGAYRMFANMISYVNR